MIDIIKMWILEDCLKTAIIISLISILIGVFIGIYGPCLLAGILRKWLSCKIKIDINKRITSIENAIGIKITYTGKHPYKHPIEYLGAQILCSIERDNSCKFKNESTIFFHQFDFAIPFKNSLECIHCIRGFQKASYHKSIVILRCATIFNLIIVKDITDQIMNIQTDSNIAHYQSELKDKAYDLWNFHGRREGNDKRDWHEAEKYINKMIS